MKKVFLLMSMAATMFAFAGCQKNEQEAPVNPNEGGSTFEFVAEIAQTKTTLDAGTYKVEWEAEDVIYMVTAGENTPWAKATEFTYADGKFNTETKLAAGNYTMNALYAASSQAQFHKNTGTTHKLQSVQTQDCVNPTAHIKDNDALVGTFTATVPMVETAVVNMNHIYTLMQVDVKNNTGAEINITKFEMTVPGADLAGIFNITSFETPAIETKQDASESITVNVTGGSVADGEYLPVYFVMAPLANYSGNVTFKVTDSKGNTYSKTVTMSGISFEAGKYNTTPYAISVADEVVAPDQPGEGAPYYEKVTSAPADWSGKYLIVYEGESGAYVFNGKDEVNGYVAAKISDNKIASTSEIDAVAVTIEPMSGGYAIKTSAGYIYGNSSSNKLSFDSSQKLNTIEYSSTNDVTITSGRVLRFNAASNQMRYRYYSSGTQQPIQLYRLAASNETPDLPDTTPSVKLETEELELNAQESEGTIQVEAKNIELIEVRVLAEKGSQDECDWLVADYDVENSCVTYLAAANETEEPRKAYIEVYCLDADANEIVAGVTVTQKGVSAGPQIITVLEFLELSVGTTEYQLTGVMEGTYNTTYGNFYLNDGTGKILVYGLTATKVATNDKSFASLGLKDGDTITIIGTRDDYNETAQVGGPAYLVSCEKNAAWDAPAISFANNIVTLVSNEGAAIYYTIDGTTPSESSLKYSEPFEIQETVTVNAVAVKEGRPNSSVATKKCEYVEISDDEVVGGSADFATISATNTQYVTGKTTAGWSYKNCAIFKGGTSDSSPAFKMIGDASNRALCMNGKTSAVGSITSPTLTTGCGTLKFNYGLPFGDTKIKFRVDIMQNGAVVKTFTIDKSSATKYTKYSHEEVVNVSGDFQIVFTNLSPSNSTSNKDRTAVWDIEWTGYKN